MRRRKKKATLGDFYTLSGLGMSLTEKGSIEVACDSVADVHIPLVIRSSGLNDCE